MSRFLLISLSYFSNSLAELSIKAANTTTLRNTLYRIGSATPTDVHLSLESFCLTSSEEYASFWS